METVTELEEGLIPPNAEAFLARMEVYCSAIDAFRGDSD